MKGFVALWLEICSFAFWRHLSLNEIRIEFIKPHPPAGKRKVSSSEKDLSGAVLCLKYPTEGKCFEDVVADGSTAPFIYVQACFLPLSLFNKVQTPKISVTISVYKQVVWWHSRTLLAVFSISNDRIQNWINSFWCENWRKLKIKKKLPHYHKENLNLLWKHQSSFCSYASDLLTLSQKI